MDWKSLDGVPAVISADCINLNLSFPFVFYNGDDGNIREEFMLQSCLSVCVLASARTPQNVPMELSKYRALNEHCVLEARKDGFIMGMNKQRYGTKGTPLGAELLPLSKHNRTGLWSANSSGRAQSSGSQTFYTLGQNHRALPKK